MNEKETVIITINDIDVVGEVIHRSSYDFQVKIISPFQNISSGSHIPYFARKFKTYDGEYGDESIKKELEYLYKLGDYLSKEMNRLKVKFGEYEKTVAGFSSELISDEAFKITEIESRKRLREGAIQNKEHQALLGARRKAIKQFEEKVNQLLSAFFEDNFPMTVSYSNKEIIDILKGNKSIAE